MPQNRRSRLLNLELPDHKDTPPGQWLNEWTLEEFAEIDSRRQLITKFYPTGMITSRDEGRRRLKEYDLDKQALTKLLKTLQIERTTLAQRVATVEATPPSTTRDAALHKLTEFLHNKQDTIQQTIQQQRYLKTRTRATNRHMPKDEDYAEDHNQPVARDADDPYAQKWGARTPTTPDYGRDDTPSPEVVPETSQDAVEQPTPTPTPTEVPTSPADDGTKARAPILYTVSISDSS